MDVTVRGALPLPNVNQPNALDPNVPPSVQSAGDLMGEVTLVNARIDYRNPSEGLTFAPLGDQLGNVKWGNQGITSAYTGGVGTEIDQPPLTFGFSVKKSFGTRRIGRRRISKLELIRGRSRIVPSMSSRDAGTGPPHPGRLLAPGDFARGQFSLGGVTPLVSGLTRLPPKTRQGGADRSQPFSRAAL